MREYVHEQMRFAKDARFRQDFKVSHRGFNIETNPELTPIVINNFNRLQYLDRTISALRSRGYENLYVIDNASTYPPLLDYYRDQKLRVFYLDQNVGYLALWRTRIQEQFTHGYYVYTDPDIEPVEECPADFVSHFHAVLQAFPNLSKVGFGLKIDDVSPHYALALQVQQHESQFWAQPMGPDLFFAPIDTTLALYRPKVVGGWWLDAARTAGPYMARHLPWYADSEHPTEEERFYRSVAAQSTHWTDLEDRLAGEGLSQ